MYVVKGKQRLLMMVVTIYLTIWPLDLFSLKDQASTVMTLSQQVVWLTSYCSSSDL